jgi:hypothetical protein
MKRLSAIAAAVGATPCAAPAAASAQRIVAVCDPGGTTAVNVPPFSLPNS